MTVTDPTLNRHEPWLHEIFLHSPDGIIIQSRDGTILNANEAFTKLCGRSRDRMIGEKMQNLIPDDLREQWFHDIDKLIRNEWTLIEGISLHANGHRIPIQISFVAKTVYNGTDAVILHIHNIAAFHTVEQALVASESQWERSFDAIADSMCLLDRSGRILRANRAMTQRFESANGPLIGLAYQSVFGSFSWPGTPSGSRHAVNDAPFVIDEATLPNVEGRFCVSAYPLKNGEDAVTGAVLIVKDITEAYQMKEALKKSETGLQQASKMEAIGRLAGGIAHDFNNILTSILGYSSLVLNTLKDNEPARNDIQEIVRAAERATALTRQLLNFSHARAVETKVVQLNTVIENLENFLRRTLGEDIQLTTRLANDLWNIQADTSRLEQILMNLAVNSRDAMPKGGQLIIETGNQVLDQHFCKLHPEIAPGNYVVLGVSDTGHGMSAQVLEHIFEPFFTTKGKGKGTGLGLTTIYGIVKQFSGYISCYSEVNKGTTFKIYLPRCLGASDAMAEVIPEMVQMRGHETLLVVDDEANIVAMISQLLTGLGYHVLSAKNSAEAIMISDQYPETIELVLTDVIMPDMRGTDLVDYLRKKRPGMEALYMSGYANDVAAHASGLKKNATLLQKPFSFDTLAKFVRTALDPSSLRD